MSLENPNADTSELAEFAEFLGERVSHLISRSLVDEKANTAVIPQVGVASLVAGIVGFPLLWPVGFVALALLAHKRKVHSDSVTVVDFRKVASDPVRVIIADPGNVIDFRARKLERQKVPKLLPKLDFADENLAEEIKVALVDLQSTIEQLRNSPNRGALSPLLVNDGEIEDQEFMARSGDRKKNTESAPKPLTVVDPLSASDRFCSFLERSGVERKEAQRIAGLHNKFVEQELPELNVVSAVQELRDQFHAVPVTPRKLYEGRRVEPAPLSDPEAFLEHYYGEDIRAGRLTGGRLAEIDKALYNALYLSLRDQEKSIADLVEPHGKPYARRARACAQILATDSAEEAGRFLGNLRAERIARHETKVRR